MSSSGTTSPIRSRPGRPRRADAGALEHPGEAVAAAQGGAKVDDRPLRRFGQRLDCVGRRHPPAGVGAERERRDGQRAASSNWASARAPARRREWRDRRRQRPGGVAERGAGGEAAEPFGRADPLAEIDDEIEIAGVRAASRPSVRSRPRSGSGGRRRRRRSATAAPGRDAPLRSPYWYKPFRPARPLKSPRRAPRSAGQGCEKQVNVKLLYATVGSCDDELPPRASVMFATPPEMVALEAVARSRGWSDRARAAQGHSRPDQYRQDASRGRAHVRPTPPE